MSSGDCSTPRHEFSLVAQGRVGFPGFEGDGLEDVLLIGLVADPTADLGSQCALSFQPTGAERLIVVSYKHLLL